MFLLLLCSQPLWRFIDNVQDERLLVYRSEDIKDFSRLQSPKVCGYLKLNEDELLPKGLEESKQNEGEHPYPGRAEPSKWDHNLGDNLRCSFWFNSLKSLVQGGKQYLFSFPLSLSPPHNKTHNAEKKKLSLAACFYLAHWKDDWIYASVSEVQKAISLGWSSVYCDSSQHCR